MDFSHSAGVDFSHSAGVQHRVAVKQVFFGFEASCLYIHGTEILFELQLEVSSIRPFHLVILTFASRNIKRTTSQASTFATQQVLLNPKASKPKLLTMCCDDLSSCLCGAMCCYCCMGGADSDNRSRRRDHRHGPNHGPVYVQPVVVSTYPVNGKAHRGGHQPNGYYYVQTYRS